MPDAEDQVREMLRRRAADVPPHVHAPPGMLRRAWRRVLMALTGGVLAVALVSVGAAVGVRLVNHSGGVGSPTAAAPACRAAELRGTLRLSTGQGHVVGSLEVTDAGDQACSLQGQPPLMIVDPHGSWLSIVEGSVAPWWKVQYVPKPKGWPVVTLQPGDSARLHVVWNSWCGFTQPAAWRIWLRGAGSLDFPVVLGQYPHCEGISSKVQVGPFEPVT